MKKNDMTDYMRLEMWVDRVEHTITSWEAIQGITLPADTRESVVKFMRSKIKKGIKKGTLLRMFMQIAVTSLLYIKTTRRED